MAIIYFSKSLKFYVDSKNGTKESEKVFGFKDNCITIGDEISSQSRTGYLLLAVMC